MVGRANDAGVSSEEEECVGATEESVCATEALEQSLGLICPSNQRQLYFLCSVLLPEFYKSLDERHPPHLPVGTHKVGVATGLFIYRKKTAPAPCDLGYPESFHFWLVLGYLG